MQCFYRSHAEHRKITSANNKSCKSYTDGNQQKSYLFQFFGLADETALPTRAKQRASYENQKITHTRGKNMFESAAGTTKIPNSLIRYGRLANALEWRAIAERNFNIWARTPHATRHTPPDAARAVGMNSNNLWIWNGNWAKWRVGGQQRTHTHTEARVTSAECSINVYYFWLCTVGVVSLTASMWSGWTPTVRRQHPHASAWKSVIHPGASCSTHSDLTRCKHTHTHQNTRARTWRRHSADDKVIEHFTNMLRLFVCRYEILPLPPQRW